MNGFTQLVRGVYPEAVLTGEYTMNKFVRGGTILAVIGLCVVFIYAQTQSKEVLSSANNSQNQIDSKNIESNLKAEVVTGDDEKKKVTKGKVAKTVSTRSTATGSFTATAYCLRGRTAMGHGVRRGLIAADPRVLRLGSRVNLGAGGYSGEYLVSDTGGRIKGRKIDIWMASCSEARRFGRRTVTIN